MNNSKKSFGARFYGNKNLMFALSFLFNIALIALIIWLGRYAKIKADLFAIIIGAVVVVGLILNCVFLLGYGKKIRLFRQIFLGLSVISLIAGLLGGYYIVRAELSINKLVNVGGDETVEYSVISFSSDFSEENMGSNRIGYLKQNEEFETLFKNTVREHSRTVQYVEFEDYNQLLIASIEGEIQYGLVPFNYVRLAEGLKDEGIDPFKDTHVLFSFSTKISDDFSEVDVIKEPFTVLLLGNNEGLSDSIIVASVNPQTLRVTMSSLARDSYVPIACYPGQSRDKLNHARGRGRQCITNTIENLLDIEIDFYFETDFYALEKIVDALGGLEIDSPVQFAGSFPVEGEPGKYDPVSVPQGLNLLNGKQTVTFARERHHMPRGDFDRQYNQQYVIREIATKLIRERNPERLVSVLEGASNNLTMNFTVDDLTGLLGYAINQSSLTGGDPMSTFRIIQSQISGETPMINGLWVVLPYKEDIDNVKQAIAHNLKTKIELNEEKSMNFSIKNPFTFTKRASTGGATIDKGPVTEEDEDFKVPTFTSNYTKDEIISWGKNQGVEITFKVISKASPDFRDSYANGQIIHQTVDAGLYEEKPRSIGISIVEFDDKVTPPPVVEEKPKPVDPKPVDPKPEEPTQFPDKTWSLDEIRVWGKKYNYEIKVEEINKEEGGEPKITHVSEPEKDIRVITVTLDFAKIVPAP